MKCTSSCRCYWSEQWAEMMNEQSGRETVLWTASTHVRRGAQAPGAKRERCIGRVRPVGDVHGVKQSSSWFQLRQSDHRFPFSNPRRTASV